MSRFFKPSFVMLCVLLAGSERLGLSQSSNPPGIDVQQTLNEAQTLFAYVESNLITQSLPQLRVVKLSFLVAEQKQLNGSVKRWIPLPGASTTGYTTEQFNFLLHVPANPPASAIKTPASQALETAIVNAAIAAKKALPATLPAHITIPDVKVDVSVSSSNAQVQLVPLAAGTNGVHHVTLIE